MSARSDTGASCRASCSERLPSKVVGPGSTVAHLCRLPSPSVRRAASMYPPVSSSSEPARAVRGRPSFTRILP
jgi:hypothetical protein